MVRVRERLWRWEWELGADISMGKIPLPPQFHTDPILTPSCPTPIPYRSHPNPIECELDRVKSAGFTYYLLPTTHYLLLTTYDSLLNTQ